jgi:hypothetical protein
MLLMQYFSRAFIYLSLFSLFLFPLLSGCAAIAISAAGAGAGVGFPYVFSDCADRTLNYSFDQVDRTTPKVLKKMDISLLAENETETGKRIKASTNRLEITIDMEKITMRATRVTINTKKGSFLKDKATAEEILNQLEKNLIVEMSSNKEKSPVKEKPRFPEKSLTKSELTKPPRTSPTGVQEGYR